MPLSRKSSDFEIHVDPSCTTNSTDLGKAPKNDGEKEITHEGLDKSPDEILAEAKKSDEEVRKKFGDEKTEALIRAAAQDVLAKMELERAGYDADSLLSVRTEEDDESHVGEDTSEVTREADSEVSYTEEEGTVISQDGHTETSYTESTEMSHDGTEMSYDESSEVSCDTGYGDGTEISYDDTEDGTTNDVGTGIADDQDFEQEAVTSESGSVHTHNDNDDVFSQTNDRGGSSRNSLNSFDSHPKEALDGMNSAEHPLEEKSDQTTEAQEVEHEEDPVGIEEDTKELVPISPASEISAMPLDEDPVYTPSKQNIHTRLPFRTPSSVRAIQMSSPAPSIFNGNASPNALRAKSRASQTSNHSPGPSTSRTATPSSQSPTIRMKNTPGLFKFKTEHPLVLLHVTVLPLHFPYNSLLDSGEPLPESVQPIRETWRLLQDKLGDVILSRGILLPHPQDSYEVLEEVLLDALELPARKRGEILKCGHYLSASSTDLAPILDSSESELSYEDSDDDLMGNQEDKLTKVTKRYRDKQHMCSTCDRVVKIDRSRKKVPKERRFRVKVYASNGLMGAGAWQAAWREMERVDVEIEPFIKEGMVAELDNLQNLWNRHVEEMEKRSEEQRQQEFEEEQQQQQEVFEQQQREYEQHQAHEQYGMEQQIEQHDIQDFIQENPQSVQQEPPILQEELPELVNEPESHLEDETADIQAEQTSTAEMPAGPTTTDVSHEEQAIHQSPDAQRLREIYGNGPEALEKIDSARASVVNSRPPSQQFQGSQTSFNNSQSSPVPPHALAARLQGLHSVSPARSPERLRSTMHSSSPSRSSGYGGMGMGRNDMPPHLAQPFGGESNLNYVYPGERSHTYAHNEEFVERGEEFMRERLRRRTEKGRAAPRFGEGLDDSGQQTSQAQAEMQRENRAKNREGDSFLELLLEALKVAMRDRKNVIILILGILVLFFALKPTDTTTIQSFGPMGHEPGNIVVENPVITTLPDEKRYHTQRHQDSEHYGYDYAEHIEDPAIPPPKRPEYHQDVLKAKPKSKSNPNSKSTKSQVEKLPSLSSEIRRQKPNLQPPVRAQEKPYQQPQPEAEGIGKQLKGRTEAGTVVQHIQNTRLEVEVVGGEGDERSTDLAEEEEEEEEEDMSITNQPDLVEENVSSTMPLDEINATAEKDVDSPIST